jgi:hypothetical protein
MSSYIGVSRIRHFICCRTMPRAIAILSSNVRSMVAVRVSAALMFGLLSLPAHGQTADGLVGGVTRDSAGKPVAEVQIVAHNLDRGTDQSTTSDANGLYTFTHLGPGKYDVAATKSGFQKASARVAIAAREIVRVDLPLAADVSPTTTKSNNEPLTDRERELLQRIDRLETRLAAMETKDTGQTPAVPKAASAAQPLEAALNPGDVPGQTLTASANAAPAPKAAEPAPQQAAAPVPTVPEALQEPEATKGVDNFTPFAYGDFSWANGTGRGTSVFTTKFFTPEIRFDTHFMEDFNQPHDHTMGGATESFRSGEFQVEQISFGGDFRWNNVRGRVLTMNGLFATTTPRNDASAAVGQWDVRNAYKYVSEAWGGYTFNVNHGLNVDAGIFVSYIGLFSYYNFDNWTYQPSFVSSNTPWFFNGLRIQWFPTNKLKIEPWIINGWQSYNKFNSRLGLGGQILWRPYEWLSLVFNNYGMGTDTLFNGAVSRIHTDDSVNLRYYNKPESTGISKMALSFTADLGCEYGGGASCFKDTANGVKTSFAGWMLYDRLWWGKDHHAITVGGGMMDNPGRYLTLLPPINGADAISGSPYFTENFGDTSKMWDGTITYQWMPKQYITWWTELGYRHSNVPYWTGRGGITPPGGNNGVPNQYACSNGAASGITSSGNIANDLPNVEAVCGPLTGNSGASSVWFPDLRKSQTVASAGVMVRF